MQASTKTNYRLERGFFKVFRKDGQTFIEVQHGVLQGQTFMVWEGMRNIRPNRTLTITIDGSVQSKVTSQLVSASQGAGTYSRLWQIHG